MTATIPYPEQRFGPLATAQLKAASLENLKLALGVSVVLCVAALGLFKALNVNRPKPVIATDYRPYIDLGIPVSLTDQNGVQKEKFGPIPRSFRGLPVPVNEKEASFDTGPTQDELVKAGKSATAPTEETKVIPTGDENVIPERNVFVPYDTPPAPLETPQPEYPAIARQAGVSGTVIVQLLLDLDGSVMKTVVARSSGNASLDDAATEGAMKFKFTPAKQRDKPIRVWVSMPIRFTLFQ